MEEDTEMAPLFSEQQQARPVHIDGQGDGTSSKEGDRSSSRASSEVDTATDDEDDEGNALIGQGAARAGEKGESADGGSEDECNEDEQPRDTSWELRKILLTRDTGLFAAVLLFVALVSIPLLVSLREMHAMAQEHHAALDAAEELIAQGRLHVAVTAARSQLLLAAIEGGTNSGAGAPTTLQGVGASLQAVAARLQEQQRTSSAVVPPGTLSANFSARRAAFDTFLRVAVAPALATSITERQADASSPSLVAARGLLRSTVLSPATHAAVQRVAAIARGVAAGADDGDNDALRELAASVHGNASVVLSTISASAMAILAGVGLAGVPALAGPAPPSLPAREAVRNVSHLMAAALETHGGARHSRVAQTWLENSAAEIDAALQAFEERLATVEEQSSGALFVRAGGAVVAAGGPLAASHTTIADAVKLVEPLLGETAADPGVFLAQLSTATEMSAAAAARVAILHAENIDGHRGESAGARLRVAAQVAASVAMAPVTLLLLAALHLTVTKHPLPSFLPYRIFVAAAVVLACGGAACVGGVTAIFLGVAEDPAPVSGEFIESGRRVIDAAAAANAAAEAVALALAGVSPMNNAEHRAVALARAGQDLDRAEALVSPEVHPQQPPMWRDEGSGLRVLRDHLLPLALLLPPGAAAEQLSLGRTTAAAVQQRAGLAAVLLRESAAGEDIACSSAAAAIRMQLAEGLVRSTSTIAAAAAAHDAAAMADGAELSEALDAAVAAWGYYTDLSTCAAWGNEQPWSDSLRQSEHLWAPVELQSTHRQLRSAFAGFFHSAISLGKVVDALAEDTQAALDQHTSDLAVRRDAMASRITRARRLAVWVTIITLLVLQLLARALRGAVVGPGNGALLQ